MGCGASSSRRIPESRPRERPQIELPDTILGQIFRFLTADSDAVSAALTCKRFSKIVKSSYKRVQITSCYPNIRMLTNFSFLKLGAQDIHHLDLTHYSPTLASEHFTLMAMYCTNLKSLHLPANMQQVPQLPGDVCVNLGRLQKLEFLDCGMSEVSDDCLPQFSSLYHLSLCQESFPHFTPDLSKLTSLKFIYCGSKAGGMTPNGISVLSNLRRLNFSESQIVYIPNEVGKLPNLEVLKLNENNICKLPSKMSEMNRLRVLNVSENSLKSLPKETGTCVSLEFLDVHSNRLTKLPDALFSLSNLRLLNLGDNKLLKLPDSMSNLKSLEKLMLENNNLTAIPPSIGELTNLIRLDIDNNSIRLIPEELGQLMKLQELFLHSNPIADLPHTLVNLTRLISLSLHDCMFTVPPLVLGEMAHLESIILDDNPLQDDLADVLRECGAATMIDTYRCMCENASIDGDESADRTSLATPTHHDSPGSSHVSPHPEFAMH